MIIKSRTVLTVFTLFVLAACADSDEEDAKDNKKSPIPICPQVALVRELSDVTDFGNENPNANELVAEARLVSVDGTCEFKKDGVDVVFELNLEAARGPRLGSLQTSFPYFVAVVDPDHQILNKELMTANFSFSSDTKISAQNENLHVFIPFTKDKRASAPNYRVLIGYQMNAEQLRFNQEKELKKKRP